MITAPIPTPEDRVSTCCDTCIESGKRVLARVKQAVKAGNARHVVIQHAGHVVLDVPLPIAVIGIVAAPQVAALGTVAALVTDCTFRIERQEPRSTDEQSALSDERRPSSEAQA